MSWWMTEPGQAPFCREIPDINFKTWNSETAVYSVTFWFHEHLATAWTLQTKKGKGRERGKTHDELNSPRGLTRSDLSLHSTKDKTF
jgi:hypothetical protein